MPRNAIWALGLAAAPLGAQEMVGFDSASFGEVMQTLLAEIATLGRQVGERENEAERHRSEADRLRAALAEAGFGGFQPLNPEDTAEARAQSRRIELSFSAR